MRKATKSKNTPGIELFGGGIDAIGLDPKTGDVEIYELEDDEYCVFERFNEKEEAFASASFNPESDKNYCDLILYHFDYLREFVKYLYKNFPLN